jgi:DNA repair protein RadC
LVELLPIRESRCITGVLSAAAMFAPHLAHAREERLAVAHLDRDQRVLSFTLDSDHAAEWVEAPIRSIVSEALARDAMSLIIGHNHPSGIALPSEPDREFTRVLARTLKPLGLKLQDHLIFAGQDWISFRGLGLI